MAKFELNRPFNRIASQKGAIMVINETNANLEHRLNMYSNFVNKYNRFIPQTKLDKEFYEFAGMPCKVYKVDRED